MLLEAATGFITNVLKIVPLRTFRFRKVLCTLQSIAAPLLNNRIKFFVAIGSIPIFAPLKVLINAEVAHLVEHDLAKVGVAGSSPVFRSKGPLSVRQRIFFGVSFSGTSPGGEIGRHAGLKILWIVISVRVRLPPRARIFVDLMIC